MNKIFRVIRSKRAALASVVLASASAAQAALPEGVEASLTDAGVNSSKVAGMVFIVLVGIFAVKLMRRGL